MNRLKPYFFLKKDDLRVRTDRESSVQWSLKEMQDAILKMGIKPPYVLHFEPILTAQFKYIHALFKEKQVQYDYTSAYILSYPIKLNAKRHVLETLRQAAREYNVQNSFEVGTKPELIAASSCANQDALIICNGYKDEAYLDIANLYARQGRNIIIVIESPFEITTLLNFILNNNPIYFKIGARLLGWGNTETRYYDKFGLGLQDIQLLSEELIRHDHPHLLCLLHFHNHWENASQLSKQLEYSFRIYSELLQRNHPLQYIDCGGSVFINQDKQGEYYDIDHYAETLVRGFKKYAAQFDIPEPTMITESGSALMYMSEIMITDKVGEVSISHKDCCPHEKAWLASNDALDSYHQPDIKSKDRQLWLNFSVFDSVPDAWGIHKRFPIVSLGSPEKSHENYQIFDISCDPDGVIETDDDYQHIWDSPYYAILFVGAYQFMLSSGHNMYSKPTQLLVHDQKGTPSFEITHCVSTQNILQEYGYSRASIQSQLPQDMAKVLDKYLSESPYLDIHTKPTQAPIQQYPQNAFLTTFQTLAKRHPDKIALIAGERRTQSISFKQLLAAIYKKAEQLRAVLHREAGAIIGVVDNKNIDTVLNIFSILSIGGVYVPLRPDLPQAKQQSLVQSSNMQLLLDDNNITTLKPAAEQYLPAPGYILYTSGTSGTPKGVNIQFDSVIWLIQALRKRLCLTEEVIGVNGPLTFDTSVKQMFQILHGHSIVLIPEAIKLDSEKMRDYICKHHIAVLDMTPSLWLAHQLYEPPLSHVLLGGEPLSEHLFHQIQSLMHRHTHIKFYNLYGPTETTVDASVCALSPELPMVSLGQPLDGVEVRIKEEEILIASPGVFHGYHNAPEQTQQKLLYEAGKRWYKTGDKGKLITFKGQKHLLYLGRMDRQCKIRGYRIELEEISYFANQHPSIEASIAVSYQNTIALFYKGDELDSCEISTHLKKHIEHYKIPETYIQITRFPLNKNGKICTQTLERRFAHDTVKETEPNVHEAKGSPLLEVAKKILQKADLKEEDDFFAAGGDSISAILLVNGLRKHKRKLTVQDIYNASSLKECFEKAEPLKTDKVLQKHHGNLPLLPIHHRFAQMIKTDQHHWNQSLLVRLHYDNIDYTRLEQAIDCLLSLHPIFKTSFSYLSDSSLQLMQTADISETKRLHIFPEYDSDIIQSLQNSFIPSKGSLFSFAFFERGREFFATFHHFLCDGLTIRLIINKLFEYYENGTMMQEADDYQQWCETIYATKPYVSPWYQHYLEQEENWCLMKKGLEESKEKDMILHSTILNKEDTRQFMCAASKHLKPGGNPILLYALSLTLGQHIQQGGLWIDMETHGRCPHVDLNVGTTLGWFTSIYPVYLDCKTVFHFEQLLQLTAEMENVKPYHATFGIMKYLQNKVPKHQKINNHSIKFNFLGQFSSENINISYIPHPEKKDISLHCESPYPLEIEAYIYQEQLHIDYKYNPKVLSKSLMASLQSAYQGNLHKISQYLIKSDMQLDAVLSPVPSSKTMLQQSVPGAYIEQFLFALKPTVSLQQVKKAWEELIDAHEVLRSGFYKTEENSYIQVIHQHSHATFEYPKPSSREDIEALIQKDRYRGFTDDELHTSALRFYLFTQNERHYCLWSHHHAILDGTSFNSLINEWMSLLANHFTPEKNTYYSRYLKDVIHHMQNDTYFSSLRPWLKKNRSRALTVILLHMTKYGRLRQNRPLPNYVPMPNSIKEH